ncbi:DUF4386 domain-containing protein [Candidatus Hodarchaeum mangrovi]
MNSEKITARIVGLLFITASAAPLLTYPFLRFLYERAQDYLITVSVNETQVLIGMLLEIICTLAVLSIPIMLFPVLKMQNEAGALGFLGFRFIEAIGTFFTSIILLSLVVLSQEFVEAGTPAGSYYQTLGAILLSLHDAVFLLGLGFVFALSALVLNHVLYQSQLIPRWLSGWGLVGAILMITGYLIQLFIIDPEDILFIPIAL